MPKVESREVWKAKAKLRISRIALALQYREKGTGSKKKRHITPTDWKSRDNKDEIVIDVGKKVKGWLKEQMKTIKPSMVARLQYGVMCKSVPVGFVPIGTLADVEKSKSWASFQHVEDYELNGLPEPEAEYLMSDLGKQVTGLYYVLPGPVDVDVEINTFANGVTPDAVKNWLETLGPMKGLGDKHNAGFGTFELLDFEVVERRDLTF